MLASANTAGWPRGITYAGFGAQSTKVAPLIANGAEPPPLMAKSQRLADSRAISTGSRGLAARRGGSEREPTGSPSDAIAMKGVVGRASVAAQIEADIGAGVARHIEHQFEPGARSHRKLTVERLEWLARLAVDGDDEGFCAAYRDSRQTRGRGVAEAEPHSRARSSAELQWRGRGVGENDAAFAPASPADGGIGEIVLDLAARVDVPVRQDHRGVEIDVRRLRLVDDDRAEQPAPLLAGVGRARMRQIEIEAGIRGDKADFGARARFEPFLGEAANSGSRVRRA